MPKYHLMHAPRGAQRAAETPQDLEWADFRDDSKGCGYAREDLNEALSWAGIKRNVKNEAAISKSIDALGGATWAMRADPQSPWHDRRVPPSAPILELRQCDDPLGQCVVWPILLTKTTRWLRIDRENSIQRIGRCHRLVYARGQKRWQSLFPAMH